ncbi:5'-methylthioadenosine/S-adenosylhomocysteine nucleosidase [Thalassotalea agarivorans]|uniref:5'-methylthioadenosine/S-adenosylhomocysteine nucleosidase n=1 Tax=Thalassotalea agarivorans TaxID=349064 RepID=A0A1I0AW53_THASX|nr:5'-methylthioadenosine/S-adenosylhomocysteine nucleosidase [Thalassotalea agarivorans]SES98698.1 methylthioadenosine nucleosidase /adenosylhomocysteine nucleosidase [Thalassotalea agarivorans]
MKAGIIGAMEPEVAILKSKLSNVQTTTHAGFTFYQGEIDGSEVVLVQSGIGKVAAALATALLIDKYSPDYVVNTGSAGGFDPSLKVGDIVVSSEVRYHDVNVTAFGYEIGQLPGNPPAYIPHSKLVDAAKAGIAELNDINTLVGLITTGDTFMTADEDIAKARKNFPTMAAVEMEGAAIAHTCHQFNVPFVVIRSMSDIAGKESPTSFEAYLETASVNSSQLVINMLNQLASTTLN